MLIIKDNISITLYIGGKEYALSRDTFEKIYTIQNVRTLLPTCRLVLNDTVGFFDMMDLTDGIPITIEMNRGSDDSEIKSYNYILVGSPQASGISNGKQYTLNGILDNVKYLRERPLKGYAGTTSEVIKQIASECNLESDVVDTDDEMDWFSGSLTYGGFVQKLSDYGYVDENSCMMSCVTEDGKLLYKNITTLPEEARKPYPYYFTTVGEKGNNKNFKITSSQWDKSSGFVNMMYGYNYSMMASSISGELVNIDKMKFKKNYSNQLSVNKNNLGQVSNMKIDYCPPDCGNTYKNYYQALYQNKRARCMYSTDFIIRVNEWTDQQLLDIVHTEDVNHVDVDNTIQTNYVVTTKTRYVSNDLQYIEQLTLTTSGKNTDNTNLV